MKRSTRHQTGISNSAGKRRKHVKNHSLLPALVAAGGAVTLAGAPASALELGQIQIQSTLGQPLRASIAYALNPNEEMYDFCVFLNKGLANDGLPLLTKARITVTPRQILLSGTVPIREPMLSMRLTVDCPYTAHLSREYMLMINPPGQSDAIASTSSATSNDDEVPAAATRSEQTVAQIPQRSGVARVADESPIAQGDDYRVQIGDSVSGIASRIENRSIRLWPAVDAIYAANPAAFFNEDVNQLKAGSILSIPMFSESFAASAPVKEAAVPVMQESGAVASAYTGFDVPTELTETFDSAYVADTAPEGMVETFDSQETAPAVEAATEESVVDDDTAFLGSGGDDIAMSEAVAGPATANSVAEAQPGDLFVGSDIPPDASLDSDESLVPVVAVNTGDSTASSGAWTWLKWLAGTGVALFAGLLLFGRRLRGRLDGAPAAAVEPTYSRRASDLDDTQTNSAIGSVDYQLDRGDFEDAAPGDRSVELDADLGAGTGLQVSDDVDVAQDFGFSATAIDEHADLDLEISAADVEEVQKPETDIIPPQHIEQESILESEVPPDDDDDGEYDLSMIVDATRQALGDSDGTAKDLMAVQIARATDKSGTDYTLSKEVDYQILEQDYEDELTATQALNLQIEKVAMQLASRMGEDTYEATADLPISDGGDDDTSDSELTTEMPFATMDSEMTQEMPVASADDDDEPTSNLRGPQEADMTAELTAELPTDAIAENEEFISDLDDTGVNEELTAEMPASSGDDTVEMDIEGGTIDTKKIAG